ncbi:MAG: glycosyltransferase family 39 protein [Candidatus Coatesbacteria bacterium]|nr:glycosyltransferase family 39 protein [Candidatus Coatesbacteria bacterium]
MEGPLKDAWLPGGCGREKTPDEIGPSGNSTGIRAAVFSCMLIVTISLLALTYQIDEPFWGIQDFNCVLQSIAARNFLNYGFGDIGLMPALNTGDVHGNRFILYVHHPPTIAYYLAAFYWVLGESEWVGRLFFILCTVGSALIVYAIGRLYLNQMESLAAALIFALFPVTGYFGRMINYESPGLFFALLSFWGYCLFLKYRSNGPLWLMYSANILGLATCWEDYILPFAIAFHFLIWGRTKGEKHFKILLLPLSTIAFFVILVSYAARVVEGGASGVGGSLDWIIKLRLSSVIGVGKTFTFLQFLKAEYDAMTDLFTPIMVYAAGIWLMLLIVGRIRGKRGATHFDWLILSLFLYAIIYLFVFRQPAYLHSYMVYYMAPAVAFAAVSAWREILRLRFHGRNWAMPVLAVLPIYVFLSSSIPAFLDLHRNPQDMDIVSFGRILRDYIASDEAVMLTWTDGEGFDEYYSDRELLRRVRTIDEYNSALKRAQNRVVLFMDTAKPQASPELISFLESRCFNFPVRIAHRNFLAYVIDVPRRYRK